MARQVERALGSMPGIGSSLASADWMPAVTAANAAYRDLWSSTTKMIEQLQGNLKAFGAVARGGFGRGGPSG
jgi:hypothetical protein